MLKRELTLLKRIVILVSLVCLAVVLIAGPVLAVDYEVRANMGWQDAYPLPYYWGTSLIEASEIVDWLTAQTSGFQVFRLAWQKDWEVRNELYNTWICGITGYDALETYNVPPNSYCQDVALGWGPGYSGNTMAYIIPHPYAQ